MHIFSLEGWHAGFFLRRLACRFFSQEFGMPFFFSGGWHAGFFWRLACSYFSGGWHAVIFQEVGMQLASISNSPMYSKHSNVFYMVARKFFS